MCCVILELLEGTERKKEREAYIRNWIIDVLLNCTGLHPAEKRERVMVS